MTNNELIERLQASKQFRDTGDEKVCVLINGVVHHVSGVNFINRVLAVHAEATPFSISETPNEHR